MEGQTGQGCNLANSQCMADGVGSNDRTILTCQRPFSRYIFMGRFSCFNRLGSIGDL